MMTKLEHDLRDAFTSAADLAPDNIPDWSPKRSDLTVEPQRAVHRASPTRIAVVVLSVAAFIGALAWVGLTRSSSSSRASASLPPPGDEFAITRTTLTPPSTPDPIKPGTAFSIDVPGHPVVTAYITAQEINGHVRQYRCVEAFNDGASCTPEWNSKAPDTGQFATIENRRGNFDLWTWANVPTNAAYVTWSNAGAPLWQRPVGGIVAFPVYSINPTQGIAVAYDPAGREIARTGFGLKPETSPPDPDNGLVSNLDDAGEHQLQQLVHTLMSGCLTANNGTWDSCLTATDISVNTRFSQLGGKLIPRSDKPPCPPGWTETSTPNRQSCYRSPLPPHPATSDPPTTAP